MIKLLVKTPKNGYVHEIWLTGGSSRAVTFETNFIGFCGVIIQRPRNF